jgi:hypothetical protein
MNLSRKALKLSTAALTFAAVGGGALASTASAQTNPPLQAQLASPVKVMQLVNVKSLEQQLAQSQLALISVVSPGN